MGTGCLPVVDIKLLFMDAGYSTEIIPGGALIFSSNEKWSIAILRSGPLHNDKAYISFVTNFHLIC